MYVYELGHCYERLIEDYPHDVYRIIGVYDSEETAKAAKMNYSKKPGFKEFPIDCFYINRYRLDEDNWKSGFITYDHETGNWNRE